MLFEKTYGIDLGSSSVKVYSMIRNKSYIEKNMIAAKGRKIIAVGNEAYEMFEKAPSDISVSSPMAFGMIANLELQEIVLYSMMRKIDKILGIGSVMYFAVPLDMTAIEKRAYYQVANGHLFFRSEWTLAAEEQGLHGRGSYCRCHSYGCGSGE